MHKACFYLHTFFTNNQYIDMICVFVTVLLSKPQQYKMAKYCEEIFGDLLLKQPLENYVVNLLFLIQSIS